MHVDDHLVVVHKDAGLLTVPAPASRSDEPCLVDLLERELDRASFGRYRLAVIHRLDLQTSGLLVFARTPTAAAHLAKQFAGHRHIERQYVAIVAGNVEVSAGTIRERLEGKQAVTHFAVLERQADATTVAVRLETGRRNQIRLHFAGRGHPVIGDTRFAPELARHDAWPHARLALHARELGFVHPVSRARLTFTTPLPAPFVDFAGRLA